MRNETLAASLLVVRWVIGWIHHVGNEMKISKSKQDLARIISKNGGWRDRAEWAAQDSKMDDYPLRVCLYVNKPKINKGDTRWSDEEFKPIVGDGIEAEKQIPNWHQTILSRAEYLHLYPAPDDDGWIEHDGSAMPVSAAMMIDFINSNGGGRYVKATEIDWGDVEKYRKSTHDEMAVNVTPTIEQLSADYRNAKDYAERKQQEADAAKADTEAKLKALELAGEALGLLVSPITEKQEHELVITDWRDLQVGDEVECVKVPSGAHCKVGDIGCVSSVLGGGIYANFDSGVWYSERCACFTFIRRP